MQPWFLKRDYNNVYFHAILKGGNIGEKTPADHFIIKLKTAQQVCRARSLLESRRLHQPTTGSPFGGEWQ
jgi:hypothetical protein